MRSKVADLRIGVFGGVASGRIELKSEGVREAWLILFFGGFMINVGEQSASSYLRYIRKGLEAPIPRAEKTGEGPRLLTLRGAYASEVLP